MTLHPSEPYGYQSLGYQQLSAGTAAAGTVLTMPTHPVNGSTVVPALAVISCTSGNARYLDTGGTPSGTVGMPLLQGERLNYDAPGSIKSLRFVSWNGGTAVAGTATLDITYYG